MTVSEALRLEAERIEHGCEFNVSRTLKWSLARRRENDANILRARDLRDRADQIDSTSSPDVIRKVQGYARA